MRTLPASTIGEIGVCVGVAAILSASGDKEGTFGAGRGWARTFSSTEAGLAARLGGRVSMSLIMDAKNSRPRLPRGGGFFPYFPVIPKERLSKKAYRNAEMWVNAVLHFCLFSSACA